MNGVRVLFHFCKVDIGFIISHSFKMFHVFENIFSWEMIRLCFGVCMLKNFITSMVCLFVGLYGAGFWGSNTCS